MKKPENEGYTSLGKVDLKTSKRPKVLSEDFPATTEKIERNKRTVEYGKMGVDEGSRSK